MNVELVDLNEQDGPLRGRILDTVQSVITSSAFIGGSWVKQFESHFAEYVGANHCVGLANGTDALYVALKAFGIKAGDEVITAANSFIATSEAISMTGATPVFVDCQPDTFNIDPEKMAAAITGRTRAIIPVHLYGQPANLSRILEIARQFRCLVIEDAAQAHGACYQGRHVGTFGDCGCFSFFPGKNLGAYGDGGAIVTNNDEIATWIRMYANHGRLEKYSHEFEGINSRLDSIQAAVLSVKLTRLDQWTHDRRTIAKMYTERLRDIAITPTTGEGSEPVYHLYVIRVQNRDKVRDFLLTQGVSTGVHYPMPLPLLPAYRHLGYKPHHFETATQLSQEILSLPIHGGMSHEKVEYVVAKVSEAVRQAS